MKHKLPLLLLLGVGVTLAPLTGAQAQPDPNNAPKAQNPQNWGNNNQFIFRRQLTPDQIKQMQVLAGERKLLSIREQLTQAGFADTPTQDAVVAFYKDKEAARAKLQEQWQAVNKAVGLPETTDAQLATQLNDFQASADQEKARRATAFKDLSTKIGLAQKPRLQALLMRMGLEDDETSLLQTGGMGGLATTLPGGVFNVMGGDAFGALNGNGFNGNAVLNGNALDAIRNIFVAPIAPVAPVPAPPAANGKAQLQAFHNVV